MKILTCPMNGPRNIDEFQYMGPLRAAADPAAMDDKAWARHVFRAESRRGVITEWWRHSPSNYVFLAERDIVSNTVVRTYDPSDAGGQP
jgi:sarcosine oxidase subunit delta